MMVEFPGGGAKFNLYLEERKQNLHQISRVRSRFSDCKSAKPTFENNVPGVPKKRNMFDRL